MVGPEAGQAIRSGRLDQHFRMKRPAAAGAAIVTEIPGANDLGRPAVGTRRGVVDFIDQGDRPAAGAHVLVFAAQMALTHPIQHPKAGFFAGLLCQLLRIPGHAGRAVKVVPLAVGGLKTAEPLAPRRHRKSARPAPMTSAARAKLPRQTSRRPGRGEILRRTVSGAAGRLPVCGSVARDGGGHGGGSLMEAGSLKPTGKITYVPQPTGHGRTGRTARSGKSGMTAAGGTQLIHVLSYKGPTSRRQVPRTQPPSSASATTDAIAIFAWHTLFPTAMPLAHCLLKPLHVKLGA